MLHFCCLQTKEGKEARGLTAQEFAHRAVDIHKAAFKEYVKDPAAWGYKLRFSWDGSSAHTSAQPDIDLLPPQIVLPPAGSADLQRAVETPFSLIKKSFKRRLAVEPRVRSVAQAVKLLAEVVEDVVTPEYVRSIIGSLPSTWLSVIEHGGDWAERAYR